MEIEKKYVVPTPVIDKKETESLEVLNNRYEKLATPTTLAKI